MTGIPPLDATVAARSPLSTTSTGAAGGSPTLVALVFATLVLATILSVYLAVRLYRGYQSGGGVGMLILGSGLVLLTTVPMILRFTLSNVPGVATTTQELLATACQLIGLLIILGVLYGHR